MKILALDSSGLVASVAILEDDNLLAEYTINYKKTHSQTLVPMLSEISKMLSIDFSELDAIAIAKGPGSFTGIRIGSATAKGLGLALNVPLIPVGTVDALSYNLWGCSKLICPIMDARQEQVYTGIYEFQNGMHKIHREQCAVSVSEVCTWINEMGRDVIFLGDGVPVYRERIEELLKVPHEFAPCHMARQRAASVGVLGMQYYQKGIFESARDHKPDYLRLSQAERERLEKEHAKN